MTNKASTTTRHGSHLRILAQHQLYQWSPSRAHQQDQHQINIPNTIIFYSDTKAMRSNARRIKLSTINTKQDLRRYVTWLQPTSRNPLYQHTTTASHVFSCWSYFPYGIHGSHIYAKSSDMAKEKMGAYPQSDHALPHWKCVMQFCAKFPSINIPNQEIDYWYSDNIP